jgi:NAD(P)H dehydrogenase (quinone)
MDVEDTMIAITGITGNIGSQVARNLLAQHQRIRAVVRDLRKGEPWADLGCEVVQADIHDGETLTAAFQGTEAVFLLVPPIFDPAPGFPEAHSIAGTLTAALNAAAPTHAVYLSTIGAQAAQPNLLSQHTIIETALRKLPVPITFLRPAWFMENASWDVTPARDEGIISSFLQPLDKPVPMVATADIARVATQLLVEKAAGHTIVELEGPERVTPNQIASTFASLLDQDVLAEVVPRESWPALFASQGMKNPEPRMKMLDGFNEGWIEFEREPSSILKGAVSIADVLKTLVGRHNQ